LSRVVLGPFSLNPDKDADIIAAFESAANKSELFRLALRHWLKTGGTVSGNGESVDVERLNERLDLLLDGQAEIERALSRLKTKAAELSTFDTQIGEPADQELVRKAQRALDVLG